MYGGDAGRIHWVAIRPEAQGKGLGKAAMSHALQELARWHDRCYLVTSTERAAAITLYLKFGFLPDLRMEGAREKWGAVSRQVCQPILTEFLKNYA